MRCLALAGEHRLVDTDIKKRAEVLAQEGFGALDALHIACAEAANCDYFVTCDDRVIKRYRRGKGTLYVCTPVEFVEVESGGER